MDLSTVKDVCLTDIPGDNPVGEDPKYDAMYEAIREEIAKMAGIGHGATDWDKVCKDSIQLLTENAKEFNLAIYLTAGLGITQGLKGLLVGIEATDAFMHKYWGSMYPPIKKIKIRGRALDWLNERLSEAKDQGKLASKDRDDVKRGIELLDTFKDTIYEFFEDPPSNFKSLRNWLDEVLAQIPEPKPEPPPAPETSESESGSEETSSEPGETVAAPAKTSSAAQVQVDAPTLSDDASLEDILAALQPIAGQLIAAAPKSPVGYQLARQALWGDAKVPNHSDSLETFIPAPADEIRSSLKAMFGKANWENLLQRSQDLFQRYPLWLDLQFYAAQASQNMGDEFKPVMRVLQYETYQLVEQLPKLAQLKFDDASPFASTQTRDWIEQLGSELGGGGGAAADPVAAMKSALMQKGTDAFAEALAESQLAIAKADSARDAMRMKAEVAAFCLEAEQAHWAIAMLQSLAESIQRFQVDEFEPKLAARVWSLMVRSCRELREEGPQFVELERSAMIRLANVDVGLAGELRVSKSPFSD